MKKMVILSLLIMVFMCAGFTACGGAYYGRNISASGYVEQPVYYPVYQPVYYPAYNYGYMQEPMCGWDDFGRPMRCGGPVAPSYLRDKGYLPRW
jgi:hypothetical protein